MSAMIYDLLARLGYHHPLHPPLTHLPVGMIMGAAILVLAGVWRRRSAWELSARHCLVIALAGFFPTALTGFLDWQHFYGGAWLFPIRIKMALAFILLILLIPALTRRRGPDPGSRPFLIFTLLAFFTVTGLGFFGGELVYEHKKENPKQMAQDEQVLRGENLFTRNCAGCHSAHSTETKFGPGLKGLFKREKLVSSDRPATEENIRHQLNAPLAKMPSFAHLPPDEQDALVAYLKTL